MNEKIVSEFQKLLSFLKDEKDELISQKNIAQVNKYNFKIKRLTSVYYILKKYPEEITLENYKELKNIGGVGKGSIDRIKEILETGKLSEVGDYVDDKTDKKNSIEELESIVGVGRSHAVELYEQGATSVKKLKDMVKKGDIEVNDKIKLGLKYHGVYKENIPRAEIDEYYKLIKKLVSKINKTLKLDETNKYIFEICGSYRREKTTSGDIDILISKIGTTSKSSNEKHLERYIKKFKSNMKYNDNKPLLVDDMTDKHIETKYMGFSKYKDNPVRRIDIRFINYSSYPYALLYFTGSGDFNKKMRQIAKSKGYKLSEYGLYDEDGKKFRAQSERAIFKKLDMEYLPPRLR